MTYAYSRSSFHSAMISDPKLFGSQQSRSTDPNSLRKGFLREVTAFCLPPRFWRLTWKQRREQLT